MRSDEELSLSEQTRIRTNSGVAVKVMWTVIGLVAGGVTMYSSIVNDVHNLQSADVARSNDLAEMRRDLKAIARQIDTVGNTYASIAATVTSLQLADSARTNEASEMRKDVKTMSKQVDKISAYIEAHQERGGVKPSSGFLVIPDDASVPK